MKLSRLLVDYLLQHKCLKLQGIGMLTFDETIVRTPEQEKEGLMFAPESIQFKEDRKLKEDHELIGFISKETGKIMPLAAADLDSYLELGKQLINISKPFVLESIGILQKNGQNKLEFNQGDSYIAPTDHIQKKGSRVTDDDVHFDENYLKPTQKISNNYNFIAIAALILLGLAIIGWVASYLYKKSNLSETETVYTTKSSPVIEEPVPDTTKSQTITDSVITLAALKDTLAVPTNPIVKTDAGTFNLVLEIAGRNKAVKRYADLKEWGHKVEMTTADSIKFKISFPVIAPLSDTIRHRDSLSRFFGRKVWIETK